MSAALSPRRTASRSAASLPLSARSAGLGIDPLDRLERDRVDHACMFAAALLVGRAGNVGQFEELAPRVGEAASLKHWGGLPTFSIRLAIGIGLQDP